ncbi:MAG: protocatechuate 3,4-dioxygenase [Rhodospirillaceae bacterium]|nr:protocatechuate 3,4-dioxygenase [Rhodospirillaceae bacterium]
MAWSKKDYDEIPGTYVFDGRRAAMGWPLNRMCMSLNDEENREALRQDVEGYCKKFDMSDEQIQAVKDLDALAMLRLGGNIYYMAKLGTAYNLNVQDLGAQMRGITVDEFKQMLLDQGQEKV